MLKIALLFVHIHIRIYFYKQPCVCTSDIILDNHCLPLTNMDNFLLLNFECV